MGIGQNRQRNYTQRLSSSRVLRRLVSTLPRGGVRVARTLSNHFPTSGVLDLVGPGKGLRMFLETADPFQAEMAFGVYQPRVLSAVQGLAQAGDTILMAGAQLGYVMLALARVIGPQGRVIGFEADPRVALKCSDNLKLNKECAAELCSVGLGSENVTLELWASDTAGHSSFAAPHQADARINVTVRTGDDVLREKEIRRLDGIVLDVEGWEPHVLDGLKETLSAALPRWAVIESCAWALKDAGSSAEQLRSKLHQFGWNMRSVSGRAIADNDDIICLRP